MENNTSLEVNLIAANPFVSRQTKESQFSYFKGDISEVVEMVGKLFEHRTPGYRDGVAIVNVDPQGFYSGLVKLTPGQELSGSYSSRREGETPRKHIVAKGFAKMPAARVEIILYRSDVLAEDGNNFLPSSDSNWEIISINASPFRQATPINPSTLMHNHFGSDGGTATNMTDSEFVEALRESFQFWSDKAMAGGY